MLFWRSPKGSKFLCLGNVHWLNSSLKVAKPAFELISVKKLDCKTESTSQNNDFIIYWHCFTLKIRCRAFFCICCSIEGDYFPPQIEHCGVFTSPFVKNLAPSSFFQFKTQELALKLKAGGKKVQWICSLRSSVLCRFGCRSVWTFFSLDEHWLYLRVRCRVGCCGEGRSDAHTGKTKAPRLKSARRRRCCCCWQKALTFVYSFGNCFQMKRWCSLYIQCVFASGVQRFQKVFRLFLINNRFWVLKLLLRNLKWQLFIYVC